MFRQITGGESITNRAEISDDNADTYTDYFGTTLVDVDSIPDADNFNQAGETDDLNDDNTNDENGKAGGDEDDHDPERLKVVLYDLALTKTLDESQLPIYHSDDVTFTITVTNQGNVDASDIEITDYIPTGLALNDGDWTDNNDGTATIVLTQTLTPGQSMNVPITFRVDTYFQEYSVVNRAEISDDDAAETYGAFDVDSDPDAMQGNDPQPANP